jgi:hypothetical protein
MLIVLINSFWRQLLVGWLSLELVNGVLLFRSDDDVSYLMLVDNRGFMPFLSLQMECQM